MMFNLRLEIFSANTNLKLKNNGKMGFHKTIKYYKHKQKEPKRLQLLNTFAKHGIKIVACGINLDHNSWLQPFC